MQAWNTGAQPRRRNTISNGESSRDSYNNVLNRIEVGGETDVPAACHRNKDKGGESDNFAEEPFKLPPRSVKEAVTKSVPEL